MARAPQASDSSGVLFAALYDELRQIAQRELRRGGGGSISPTTLLHEAFLKLQERTGIVFPDRAHFLAYAARAMRTLVIDFVRNKQAQKRGGAFEITSLPTDVPDRACDAQQLEKLGAAIDELTRLDPQLAQLVDLKFFCGFTFGEIASMRGVSARTVQRDWEKARILLQRSLEGLDLLPP